MAVQRQAAAPYLDLTCWQERLASSQYFHAPCLVRGSSAPRAWAELYARQMSGVPIAWLRALLRCRELLYLDLALENVVRAAAERGTAQAGSAAAAYVSPLLQNLALSGEAFASHSRAHCRTARVEGADDAYAICVLAVRWVVVTRGSEPRCSCRSS